ncbi:MAG: diphosphate--fructose-6-phosphate 1-phosphotransferase [Puniceicoccales bacterium]|jgi:6-phosphofructokinase 1|nr:diphosphate--fructose-6-phosphate 1-phosphotransferase [Puniceicoccales bacterium]
MSDLVIGNVLAVQWECLSPVSNAVLEGMISEALNYENVEEIYGSSHGFYGLLGHNLIDLASQSQQVIRDLRFTPGVVLGAASKFKHLAKEMDAIFDAFKEYNIRFLLITGGMEAQLTAFELSKEAQKRSYGLNVISIPDTIYNNLPITDHCLGYGSVSKFIATTLRELSRYAMATANHDLVNIIEIASEKSDWLIASALFEGATQNIILLPSHNFSEKQFLEAVQNTLKTNIYCNVVTTNCLMDGEGNYLVQKNARGTSVAMKLKEILEESLEVQVSTTKFELLQYVATHFLSKTDVDEAYVCGTKAIRFALDGLTGKMMTILRSESNQYGVEFGVADLANICGHEKLIPEHWFNENRELNANFSKYLSPLIQGGMFIAESNGLPKFATLRH